MSEVPDVRARMQAAAQRFKAAAERSSDIEVHTAPGRVGEGVKGALSRLAIAFAVAASVANPMAVSAQTIGNHLSAVRPATFLKVNGERKEIVSQASVAQLAQAVSSKLGNKVKPDEIYNYLVYAHGLDWKSMAACYAPDGGKSMDAWVPALVAEYNSAHQWAVKKVQHGGEWYRVEARYNYMLSSTKDCREWSPGVLTRGQAKIAMQTHAKQRVISEVAADELIKDVANSIEFYSATEAERDNVKQVAEQFQTYKFDTYVRKNDDGKNTYLLVVKDDDGSQEAHALSLSNGEQAILVTASIMANGPDTRSAKVMAETILAHEMAHLNHHKSMMNDKSAYENDVREAMEFQANMISARDLIARGYQVEEIMDAHSRLALMEAMVGLPKADNFGLAYALSRQQTMETLYSVKNLSASQAISLLDGAIQSAQTKIEQNTLMHNASVTVESMSPS